MDRIGREELLGLFLQGLPDRVLDAAAATHPDDAADLVAIRDGLADLALAATPVRPPPALRARLLASCPRPRRPRRPVLAVLDMINDHLKPGGPLEVPRAREIVPAIQRRLADARAKGIPVLYLCDEHPPGDPDLSSGYWPEHAVQGTWGAEVWAPLAPQPGDHIVKKVTYSAFTGSKLGALLDELGADEIILTGCVTEVGLAATATDALQRGFVVTIPPDAQAGSGPIAEQLTMLALSTMPPYDPRYLAHAPTAGAG